MTAGAASSALLWTWQQVTTTPLGTVSTAPAGTTAATPGQTGTATPIEEGAGPAHYVVFLVIDAGRPSYLTLAKFPHIDALIKHGVEYDQAWVGEMESSTPDVHVTFGTGTMPKENGFMGFGWAAPQTRQVVDFRSLLADGEIDPVLRALPIPSVAAHLHQVFPHAVSIVGSGHKDYAAVGLGGGAATYELYGKFQNKLFTPSFMHTPPPLTPRERQSLTLKTPLPRGAEDAYAVTYAIDVARKTKPRLLMLNLPETDTWGHWFGPSNHQVFTQLMWNLDHQIARLEAAYRRMGILNQTDFIISADHAMMESRPSHMWKTMFQAARDEGVGVARADGEGGGVWLKDPTAARKVAEKLVTLKPAHVEAIFYRSNPGLDYHYVPASPSSWVVKSEVVKTLTSLVDTTAGRNGPDMWVLSRENYTVVPRNVAGIWKGTHGGATWAVQHVPLIISGPDIRQSVRSQFPARAIDIAPTIEYLLGLPPLHRSGVILADALAHPTQDLTAAQLERFPQLAAEVRSLQEQSAVDSRSTSGWKLPPTTYRCSVSPSNKPRSSDCKVDARTASNQ